MVVFSWHKTSIQILMFGLPHLQFLMSSQSPIPTLYFFTNWLVVGVFNFLCQLLHPCLHDLLTTALFTGILCCTICTSMFHRAKDASRVSPRSFNFMTFSDISFSIFSCCLFCHSAYSALS